MITYSVHQREREGKKGSGTCIAPIVSILITKRSNVGHTELPANTPHLPFLRISISFWPSFTALAQKRLLTSFWPTIWPRHSLRRPQFPV